MASSNKTKKLKLNQWESSDKPTMTDFNEDNRKLEEELARIAPEGVTNWNSGNVPIETGTWTPTIEGDQGGKAVEATPNAGWYMRQGKLLIARFSIPQSTIGTCKGMLRIGGIPFQNAMFGNGVIHACAGFNVEGSLTAESGGMGIATLYSASSKGFTPIYSAHVLEAFYLYGILIVALY